MRSHDGTNRLMVVRIGDTLKPYCNGVALPVGDARPYVVDGTLGPGQVGVMVTSYEFAWGDMDFDNFELTPLYDQDPGTYVPENAEGEADESSTILLDLE